MWAYVAVVVGGCLLGCSTQPSEGRVIVAVTVDWEGAEASPEALDALDALRKRVPAPFTHFVSAAYFTKESLDPLAAQSLVEAVREGDEVGLHIHAWRSLAKASGVEPKTSPSFLSGTDAVNEIDGDSGYDTDLDVYTVAELRAIARTSKQLIEKAGLGVSSSFRAGGFLATPKVVQAIRSEGYTVDSSAIRHDMLDELDDDALDERLAALWPGLADPPAPFLLDRSPGALIELPITAFADYAAPAEIAAAFGAATARLQAAPAQDVTIVLAFNLETVVDLGVRIADGLDLVRAREGLDHVVFTTVRHAADRARRTLAQPRR